MNSARDNDPMQPSVVDLQEQIQDCMNQRQNLESIFNTVYPSYR